MCRRPKIACVTPTPLRFNVKLEHRQGGASRNQRDQINDLLQVSERAVDETFQIAAETYRQMALKEVYASRASVAAAPTDDGVYSKVPFPEQTAPAEQGHSQAHHNHTFSSGSDSSSNTQPRRKAETPSEFPSETPESPRKKRGYRSCRSENAKKKKSTRKRFVCHNYHDHSNETSSDPASDAKRMARGGVTTPFPLVLHSMLELAEQDGYSQVVSWQPHGRAFHVHIPEIFVNEIMPKFFRHTKLSSFQRQLNLYGFVRLTNRGPDRGSYYHECFLRGMPHLAESMHRTRVKGTWVRSSSSPETEPNFYTMPPVGQEEPPAPVEQYTAPPCYQEPAREPSTPASTFVVDSASFEEKPIVENKRPKASEHGILQSCWGDAPQRRPPADLPPGGHSNLSMMFYTTSLQPASFSPYGDYNAVSHKPRIEPLGLENPPAAESSALPRHDIVDLAQFLSGVDLDTEEHNFQRNEDHFANILELVGDRC